MKFLHIFLVLFGIVFFGCSQKQDEIYAPQYQVNDSLIFNMDKLYGSKKGGDCSGLVMILNQANDNIFFTEEELFKSFDKSNRRSQAMYNLYKKQGKISFINPKIGDLIFFKNTTKKTKNSKFTNITHVGIIRYVQPNGKVHFLHNIRGLNEIGYMNLNQKHIYAKGKDIQNSYIIRCKKGSYGCLTSDKFIGYGVVN